MKVWMNVKPLLVGLVVRSTVARRYQGNRIRKNDASRIRGKNREKKQSQGHSFMSYLRNHQELYKYVTSEHSVILRNLKLELNIIFNFYFNPIYLY